MTTTSDAYTRVKTVLSNAGIAEPDAKARYIVAEALHIGLTDVFLRRDMAPEAAAHIEAMAQRCARGEPVEYVTGRAYFRHIVLDVCPDVLIPRQETELVVQEAVDLIRGRAYTAALDMCTGSGCIAVSLAAETGARVDACDLSEAALDTARMNARKNGADVRFFLSDMFADVNNAYDIIVSNPPYVSEDEYRTLDKSVRLFEPKLALTADDGLTFYRKIAAQSPRFLTPGGALVLEIGAGQGASVTALLGENGFKQITCKKDYAGRDRIVTALR